METNEFELFPGYRNMAKPLFETKEAEDAFWERHLEIMEPASREFARRHAEAEREFMTHQIY